ncbi:MAG: hypothetical protein JRJ84_17785, partial [Deltaproteobacteria bacterium]|nr:hypothetical protein [Deltaproteobacteria bacterium]
RSYYETIGRAMRHVAVVGNTVVCHIGRIPYNEVVVVTADFLISMKGVTRCLVSGLHDGMMVVSLRASYPRPQADEVMRTILGEEGRGGGHGAIAGGALPCVSEGRYLELSTILNERLADLPPRSHGRFHPLLDDDDRLDESGAPLQLGEGERE